MDPDELEALGLTEDRGWKSAPAVSFALDGGKEGDVLVAFAKADGKTVDKDGHITERGAIRSKKVPISAYGHSSWPENGSRLPVGIGETGEKSDDVILDGNFFMDTTHGLDTYRTVKALGELQEWSYGYRILGAEKTGSKTAKGKPIIRLKSLEHFEVSPTLVGAGVTRTIGIKRSDEDGPLAGLPFGEDFDRVLIDVEAIVARSKSLRDLRGKAGRELSETNRARLVRLRDSIVALDETKAELEELLSRTDATEDPGAKALGLELLMEYERTIAGLEGVALGVG